MLPSMNAEAPWTRVAGELTTRIGWTREDIMYRWLERGVGEAVVLLHGLLGQPHHWDDVLDDLGGGWRAVAPTLPLFDPTLEPSLPGLVRFVEGFLDALGIERAVLGGNSLGGHVALEMALAHPGRVAGVILTGSSGVFERGFTHGLPPWPSRAYVRRRMEEIFYYPNFVTDEWVEGVRQTLADRNRVLRMLGLARAVRRSNLESRLGELRVPALLVWGSEDRITPPAAAERLDALIPDSKLVFIPCCGHAPMLERPRVFARIVQGWLEEIGLRRGPRGIPAGPALDWA
jgi:pimeloyl-ACP methyl ester carboxylesterase